jgi:hypothetical protein
MKIAHYEQMMDYLTGPRERFRDGGRIGFKQGTPFPITDEKLAEIDNLIKDTNLDLKSIGKQIGYGTDKTQLKIDAPVMKAYIEKYGKPKPGRLKPANLAKDPEYVQFVIDKVKELGSKKAAAKELKIDRKTINNILKQKAPGLMKPENIPGPETGAKAIKKRSKQIIKEGEKKAGSKTTNQARKVIDSIADRNKVYANMSAEELTKDKNFLNRLRVTINNRTGAVDFTGYTETNPVRGKVFNDIELAQHAINKAKNGELFTHDHITPKRFRKQNIQYPINFQPVTYMENSQFENARTYLTNNPTDNVAPINNYLKSNNKTIRFGNNKYGYTGNIVYNSDTGNQTLLEFEKRTNVGGRGPSMTLGSAGDVDMAKYLLTKDATAAKNLISKYGPNALKTLRTGARGTGIGLALEAPFEAAFAAPALTQGDFKKAYANSIFNLYGIGKDDFMATAAKEFDPKAKDAFDIITKTQRLDTIDNKLSSLENTPEAQEEFLGDNRGSLIAEKKQLEIDLKNLGELNQENYGAFLNFRNRYAADVAGNKAKVQETFFKPVQKIASKFNIDIAMPFYKGDFQSNIPYVNQQLGERIDILDQFPGFKQVETQPELRGANLRKKMRDPEFRAARETERLNSLYPASGSFAGGGIAKLAGKSSGAPPESGPTPKGPQGLDFLIKRGRQS